MDSRLSPSDSIPSAWCPIAWRCIHCGHDKHEPSGEGLSGFLNTRVVRCASCKSLHSKPRLSSADVVERVARALYCADNAIANQPDSRHLLYLFGLTADAHGEDHDSFMSAQHYRNLACVAIGAAAINFDEGR